MHAFPAERSIAAPVAAPVAAPADGRSGTPPSARQIAPVRYAGLHDALPAQCQLLRCGRAEALDLAAGQAVELVLDHAAQVWLLELAPSGLPGPMLEALPHEARPVPLDISRFAAGALLARWPALAGLLVNCLQLQPGATSASTVLRARTAGQLWLIVPMAGSGADADSVAGAAGGELLWRRLPAATPTAAASPALPAPLGPVREEFTVPRCTARAYEVRAGECIQIIDVEGQQCSDFMALRTDALARGEERFIDGTVTRSLVGGAYPLPGLLDKYFDQDMRPLVAVVQDTVGRHDTFGLACTERGYAERGFPGHANCSDNISNAYAPWGIKPRAAWPAINLFFNTWIGPGDTRLRSDEGWSRAGDHVVLRALTDLVCVSTSCPDDTTAINGWNPTDIHVRIYASDVQIPPALAYRPEATTPAAMTEPSAFHARTSALTRHYAPARDLWLPVNYEATRALEEYRACREAVTVQDLSALRKFDVTGPDAERLLELALTRDVRRLSVHRGLYALACDEAGAVIDDGTLFRMAPDVFRWLPSSEQSALHLRELAARHGFAAWVRAHGPALPNLAVQGPASRALLSELVFTQPTQPALASLKWFGFTIARLHHREGPAFMLTRSGYTGELGYEIFCRPADALAIWDALMEAGAAHGLVPMGSEALGLLRVEAGLAAQGAEFGGEVDAFEAGLGFAVDFSKPAFIGRAALQRIQAAPRRVLTGLLFAGNEVPTHGDAVFLGRQRVGTVTSAVRSPALGTAIALARVAHEHAAAGTALEVGRLDGLMKRLPCTTAAFPFVDPERKRVRA